MSRVIIPADLDVVTAEDVHAAIIEQFCGLSDERAKEIVPVLIENMNFTAVMDRVRLLNNQSYLLFNFIPTNLCIHRLMTLIPFEVVRNKFS